MFTTARNDGHLADNIKGAAISGFSVQPKLKIGTVDDPLEHEADAIADKVMSMQEIPTSAASGSQSIQRKCSECEEEDKVQRMPSTPFIQRKESSSGTLATEAISHQIQASKGSGRRMDSDTQSFMQNRFGADFNDVKIHTGNESVQMNRELNAKAFTVGRDIHFNDGQYNPGSDEGKRLLAHELTHTMQQGSSENAVQRKVKVDPGLKLDVMGFSVTKSGDVYTCPKVSKSSVWNEIFTAMLHSPRIFKLIGTTNSEINSRLKMHMAARLGIIQFAAKRKYSFAAGAASKVNTKYWKGPLDLKPGVDRQEALDDLNKNPKKYAIACLAATTMTMVGGAKSNYVQLSSSDPNDWIPGDWGYIENTKFSGKTEDVGLEGENIIYVGLDQFWGHLPGTNTYRTYQEWFDEVKSWNGEAKAKDLRRFPLIGFE